MWCCIKQNQTTNPGGSWNSRGKSMLNYWNAWDCVWDESSVRRKSSAFFTATSTNTGTTAWGLSGVALADNGDLNLTSGMINITY